MTNLKGDVKNEGKGGLPPIPKIENIHQKVYAAASGKNALNMNFFHPDEKIDDTGAHCGTTHCRAGWVVALAGPAGVALERGVKSTAFAAMLIYRDSSEIHVSSSRFYVDNETAMKDMKECAEKEAALALQKEGAPGENE